MAPWDEFVNSADRHFKYLEDEFGFKRTSVRLPSVVYESHMVRVRILFSQFGGRRETGLEVESIPLIGKYPLGIDVLIRFRDPKKKRTNIYPADNDDALDVSVREMAELLKEYGSDILSGDLYAIMQIEELRKQLADKEGRNKLPS